MIAAALLGAMATLGGCDGLKKHYSNGENYPDADDRQDESFGETDETDAALDAEDVSEGGFDRDEWPLEGDGDSREYENILNIPPCLDRGWVLQTDPTTRGPKLNDVWGVDENNVWAAGDSQIMYWDGNEWIVQNLTGGLGAYYAVWAYDLNNVWAVGERGRISFWDGQSWTEKESPAKTHLRTVWGYDLEHVWAAGYNEMLFWNGSEWIRTEMRDSDFERIWGIDSSHVWALESSIRFFDGIDWVPQPGSARTGLTAISGINAGSVWATWDEYGHMDICEQSFVLHWDGKAWRDAIELKSFPLVCMRDLFAADKENIWAAGSPTYAFSGVGALYTWTSAMDWTDECYTRNSMRGIWGTDANHIWAVGGELDIMFYGGD